MAAAAAIFLAISGTGAALYSLATGTQIGAERPDPGRASLLAYRDAMQPASRDFFAVTDSLSALASDGITPREASQLQTGPLDRVRKLLGDTAVPQGAQPSRAHFASAVDQLGRAVENATRVDRGTTIVAVNLARSEWLKGSDALAAELARR